MLFFSVNRFAVVGVALISVFRLWAGTVPLGVSPVKGGAAQTLPLEVGFVFPGECNLTLHVPHATNWLEAAALHLSLVWPAGAPVESRALVWLKDRDDYWHQNLVATPLAGGQTNSLVIPFQPGAAGWQTPGHSLVWHHRVRLNPQSVGFRVFSDTAFTGKCVLVSATLETREVAGPPVIAKIRPVTRAAQALSLYEARFDLPDRYANPFDPTQIDTGATITTPDGRTNTVHAFYYQPHYRLEDELGEPVEPDGQPEWRVRFCPRVPGEHAVTLYARDALGTAIVTNALRFTAAPPAENAPRFVRVSQKDRRYFEFDDATLYYPIGHNVRSATDSRMDDKFPWVFRKEEGTTAYRRYFKRMQDAGENMAEVWMSAWSLGLEWTEGVSGYHGANDYHMGNAWELDRVIDLAFQHRIYLNLVLNYHGRISSWCDPEWHLHPYNKATPGGWLTMPLEFFSDGRAIEMQKRFCRYTQARWGWAPVIFGYELCSELNLTGHETHHRTHFVPEVVEWCRVIGAYLKTIDPYGHLVSSHISNDYTFLNPVLCNLPEMDFTPLDAYHHGQPERIIALAASTADAGAAYNKPILITEFGGSPMAAGREHLMIEQHAALWVGACVPLAGVPMFWWWQVVDENNLYVQYTAVKRFMENTDPRDTAAKRVPVTLSVPDNGDQSLLKKFNAVCTASPEKARGYIYPTRFARAAEPPPEAGHLTIAIDGLTPGIFRVEFFETATGTAVRRFDVRTQDSVLSIPVPHFRPDFAFKAYLLTPVAKRAF
ncbi:MAG: DUF5060 domain-containing protein [Kiritimatiellae bacterium]|nr:DUF5060 domain-containing protein [Kiritimatiellia bacterium]